MTHQLF
jgi:hypothetical protein